MDTHGVRARQGKARQGRVRNQASLWRPYLSVSLGVSGVHDVCVRVWVSVCARQGEGGRSERARSR